MYPRVRGTGNVGDAPSAVDNDVRTLAANTRPAQQRTQMSLFPFMLELPQTAAPEEGGIVAMGNQGRQTNRGAGQPVIADGLLARDADKAPFRFTIRAPSGRPRCRG